MTVSSVTIDGLPAGVRAAAGFGPGADFDAQLLESGRARVVDALVEAGYLWAEVEADTAAGPRGTAVSYRVRPGGPALLGGWRLLGGDSVPSRDVVAALPRPGGRFRRALVENAAELARYAAAARGFPLCRVTAVRVELDGRRAFPVLALDEGERVLVTRLAFVGAGGANPQVLSRSAGFRPGLVYSPARVRSWRRNLEASGLATVTGEELFRAPGGYGLGFLVHSRRASRATGAVGYAAETRQLNGFAELDLRNLLNTGRRLKASWFAVARQSEYAVAYTEPWVLGQWLSLTAAARLRVADTSLSQTALDLTAVFAPGPDAAFEFSAGYEQLAALDTTISARTTWAGTGVALDSRDGAVSPTRGQALRVSTRVGQRRRVGRSRVVSRVEADGELAGPGWRRLVLDNRLHYRLVYTPDTLADQELVPVGGSASLRGYREEEFRALQAGWWNLELRYDIATDAAAYPFFDLGVLRLRDGWVVRPGYGAGVRLGTALGTFRLDYGLGWQDRPLTGKVHFGFEGEF